MRRRAGWDQQRYRISAGALKQWQHTVRAENRDDNRQEHEIEDDREADSGLVWTLSSTLIKNESMEDKRERDNTPEDRAGVDGEVLNLQNVAVPFKKTKALRRLQEDGATVQERCGQAIQRQREWNARQPAWKAVYFLVFPTFNSSQTAWSRAALTATTTLVGWMRESTRPHYLLNHLREPILADLTQHWREQLLSEELKVLQTTTADPAVKERLDRRDARATAAPTDQQRAVILNAREEWTALRAAKYEGSARVALCVEPRRVELGRLLLCAMVYTEEIHSLTGAADTTPRGPEAYLAEFKRAAEAQPHLVQALTTLRDGGTGRQLRSFSRGWLPVPSARTTSPT